MHEQVNLKYALISVSDKENIIYFAKELLKRGINLISTTGTTKFLKSSGIPVLEISEYTNFPEIMNGRVKTLHPKIYSSILGRRGYDDAIMKKYGIIYIDIIVVNLYPFQNITSCKQHTLSDAIENIDIGGSAMIRAAAKNYNNVTIITNKNDYNLILSELDLNDNTIPLSTRFNLSVKAFEYTYQYDQIIFEYLQKFNINHDNDYSRNQHNKIKFPYEFNLKFIQKQDLRYGENNHQHGMLYVEKNLNKVSIANSKQIQGKNLSYNNILDSDIALECLQAFEEPTCVIVKHGNPCSIATQHDLNKAYKCAYQGDPISAFGGIIAFNRKLDELTASAIIKNQFVEIIIAPDVNKESLQMISTKPNIRLLLYGNLNNQYIFPLVDFKRINGGLLVQSYNSTIIDEKIIKIVTKRQPTKQEFKDAIFGWKVVKFIKSNAIVYVRNNMTISIGAGQMSRIDSIKLANLKAQEENKSMMGSVMASDAFFPFRDSIDNIPKGVNCIIQPGGSIRDYDVINAANERNISMIFTNIRHFRH